MNTIKSQPRLIEGLSFVEQGIGQPVIYLHGGSGRRQWFDPLVPLLGLDMRHVTVDLPGHGLSQRMESYSVRAVAEKVAKWLSKISDEPVILFGHSFGGHVALTIAHRYPKLCRSVIVGDSPLDLAPLKAHTKATAPMLNAWRALASSGLAISDIETALLKTEVAPGGPRFTELFGPGHRYILELAASLACHDPKFLEDLSEHFDEVHAGFDAGTILKEAEMPLLFLQADPALGGMLSASDKEMVLKCPARAEVRLLPAVSHGLQLQDPEAVATALRAHLEQLT